MIRHNHRDPKIEFRSVVMQTAIKHGLPHTFRKNPPMIGTESHKMLSVIALKMRKLSAIESLRHKLYVGTAAPGLSGGAKLRSF